MNGGRTHDETLHRVDELTAWTRRLWRVVAVLVVALLAFTAVNSALTSQKMLGIARETHHTVQFIADIQNPKSKVAQQQASSTAAALLLLVNEDRLIHHLRPFGSLNELAQHIMKGQP